MSKAMEIVSGINEFGNLFQLGRSFISYLRSQWNGKEQQIQEDDVLQLQSDLDSLRDNLLAIYNFIYRAEWRSHEHCVGELLPKLKDAVYDAEDLLDDFRWYKLKLTVEGGSTQKSPFIDFFGSVITGRFNKVVDIQNRFNSLSSQLVNMGLHQITLRFDKSVRPETSSILTEPKIFGREKELKMVITLLGVPANTRKRTRRREEVPMASNQVCTSLDSNEARVAGVSVLPIVGIGGVGKTTLVQNIYNHPHVQSEFELKMWICVSDDFDVKRLTKEAIEQSTGKAPTIDNLNCLQQDLAISVNGKRILIVLDDIWDDVLKENGQRWKSFCAPFTNVIQGSMMLVTSRFLKVADLVRTMDPFPLEGLKDHVLWHFFRFCVFGSDSSNIDPVLESIGRRILPKLKGSPPATKTLGRLLGVSLDPSHWVRILESELWELRQEDTEILPALRLSYIYLPFNLKRCFSICAVYPKDYKFKNASLAEIWVAEGFVEPQGKIPPQHIAYKYFEELAHLSFFEKHGGTYVIHDLMHDMAQLVSKDECFIITGMSDFNNVPENVRHPSILDISVNCSDLLRLCKHRKLRTLFCNVSSMNEFGATVMEEWCTKLSCMRVIFCATSSEWGLPESISNMKCLRYLKISELCLLKRLPSALFSMYNLQMLHARISDFDNIRSCLCKLINLQGCRLLRYQNQKNCEVLVLEDATDEDQKKLSFTYYPYESLPSWFP